jgi:hypothetical protein
MNLKVPGDCTHYHHNIFYEIHVTLIIMKLFSNLITKLDALIFEEAWVSSWNILCCQVDAGIQRIHKLKIILHLYHILIF